ncbi:hypothetical protein FA95DRAFT_1606642 [Auriscalpium vulgare]|uniref:Uncharacterized protein n=1 Tax=Auriscalpium vulgare TaxID=40419 RepID=A0ACB8RS14_9AGAM|nr:hypothetical protein FA95DRAFT_1606642 [Auriscalpium vulgare]
MATEVPLDVQLLVIEWVFRSSQHKHIDFATLRACALVCRAWSRLAQRLIFRHIRCTDLRGESCDIHLLVRTLILLPHLAAHVRYIKAAWPSHPPDYSDVCLSLLELCRHVEGISFMGRDYNNHSLTAELDARMRAIPLRPVLLETIGLAKAICRTILDMFPGARVLGFRTDYEHPLPPTVNALEINAHSAHQYLSHLHPLPALCSLCLITPWWPGGTLGNHLISSGVLPQLRYLEIQGLFPPQEILEQLFQLKTLVVSMLPEQHVALPPSLQHVGYHIDYLSCGVAPAAEIVVNPLRVLSELRLVTVTRELKNRVQAALETMCRDRGVDFGIYA